MGRKPVFVAAGAELKWLDLLSTTRKLSRDWTGIGIAACNGAI